MKIKKLLKTVALGFAVILAENICFCANAAELSIREKLGQMMCLSIRKWDGKPVTEVTPEVEKILEKYSIGNVVLFSENLKNRVQAERLISDLKKVKKKADKIPMMICADQEGGLVERFRFGRSERFPNNFDIGLKKHSSRLAFNKGRNIGKELRSLGLNCNFAPVVDVWSNPQNSVIGKRSFGKNASTVANCAVSFMKGQREFGILSTAKHFPGHGDTKSDSHFELPRVNKSLSELENLELIPFKKMVDFGVDMIMTAHIELPNIDKSTIVSKENGKRFYTPATMSKVILTDVLRKKLGFKGVIVTDAMDMKAISENIGEAEGTKKAILAGANMICMPVIVEKSEDIKKLDDFFKSLEKYAKDNAEFAKKIDESFSLIKKMKEKIK